MVSVYPPMLASHKHQCIVSSITIFTFTKLELVLNLLHYRRTVVSIPNGPSALAVKEAAWGLARYAAISQVRNRIIQISLASYTISVAFGIHLLRITALMLKGVIELFIM